jgi:sugar/nucleoside kinase (ribokinase family)
MNITLGDKGSLFYSNEDQFFVPVFSERIIDTIGAGDAVLSITSLLAKNRTPPEVIPLIGNLVGALAVLIVGNKESIDPIKLFKFIEYTMK